MVMGASLGAGWGGGFGDWKVGLAMDFGHAENF
jgi:hypothetical protein